MLWELIIVFQILLQLCSANWSMDSISIAFQQASTNNTDVTIAVMGPTGSGKSTFINLISGSDLLVGEGLMSCTNAVRVTEPFELDGRQVTLIDTPGFDDTAKTNAAVLAMITDFLSQEYEAGKKLNGVILLHRISDVRMSGISVRDFRMLRHLCGDSTLINVAIVTNFWELVDDDVGEARATELASQDIFFKPALDKGARYLGHYNTLQSAQNIVRTLLGNSPLPLLIQEERVDQNMNLDVTTAGRELECELLDMAQRQEEEARILRKEKEEALRKSDELARQRLEEQKAKAEADMANLLAQIARSRRGCHGHRGLRRVACEIKKGL